MIYSQQLVIIEKQKYKHMKTISTTSVLLLLFVFSFISGCVNDKDYDTPIVTCEEIEITPTNSISQVKEMYTFGGATLIENDVIIEGYVVSSDASGNIYKSISIQDKPENPTSAIKIAVDATDLYTKYPVGRKIYVSLKGLAVGYSYGSIQIGKITNGDLAAIASFEMDKYLIRTCEQTTIIPKKITASQLNKSMLEMLVEIENVQFQTTDLNSSYANIDNTKTVERTVENFDSECNLIGKITMKNSGYASFKNKLLPTGKGSIIGILSNYYDEFQLYIRDEKDVQFTNERCDYSKIFTPTTTINEVKNMFQGSLVEFGTTTKLVIEGYVISSDEQGNFQQKISIQDQPNNPTAGIQLLIDKEFIFKEYNIGDKVVVHLNKLYMNKVDGVLTIGIPKGTKLTAITSEAIANHIYNTGGTFQITPTTITIEEIQQEKHQNTLVKIDNVQLTAANIGKAFAFYSGTDNGYCILESCGVTSKLQVFTNGNALFAQKEFPKGNGSIIGVITSYIEIRNLTDIQFNNSYKTCEVSIPKIMITEVADPKNNVSARFVELYNAGTSTVNLTGWKLNKYMNGATTVANSAIDLSSISIAPGNFAIIASTDFKNAFTITPSIESTYISGNGDDVYELMDNAGKRIDIFGVIGEDGNGTNWEYLDGRAVRNISVEKPNAIFTINEWTIYSDAQNNLINYQNTPKNAPNDFNPNLR